MDNEIQHFTFFRSWWKMAITRGTPEKENAFWRAICSYAFEGVDQNITDNSTPEECAAFDAFTIVKPIIDKSLNRARAGFLGGKKSSKRKANAKQTSSKLQANAKQDGKQTPSKLQAIDKTRQDKASSLDAEASSSGGGCPSVERVVAWATSVGGIPEDYARRLHADLVSVEWTDADGKRIGSWQHFFKASWSAEQAKQAKAYEEAWSSMPVKITEDDL